LDYIIGNPPFIGHQWRTEEQQEDIHNLLHSVKRHGRLDYVSAWFYKSAIFISGTKIRVALVSTNSIVQGEQVPILWYELLENLRINIHFAHQTFQWINEAPGKAAVHVIIVGFGIDDIKIKRLFSYENIKGEPTESNVTRINPYLYEGPNIYIQSRGKPIHKFPSLYKGSQPTDGGHLIFKPKDYNNFIYEEPDSSPYFRQFIGGAELMRGKVRYCLWLKDIPPKELKKLPMVLSQLDKVRESRLKSSTKSVREASVFPALFTQDRQPDSHYLALPEVSSERRKYLPIAYLAPEIIASNKLQIIPNADIYIFGILMSYLHNAWTRLVCGRMKSDISYSPAVYNNFPFPKDPSEKQTHKVESSAQAVLDTRAIYPDSSLADLYDPLTMPPNLVKAHNALDKAVDQCYRKKPFGNERERIEFLFELYEEYTAPLFEKSI